MAEIRHQNNFTLIPLIKPHKLLHLQTTNKSHFLSIFPLTMTKCRPATATVTATLVLVLVLFECSKQMALAENGVPAIFVFGDSLVDVGNNNFLHSAARANFYPYGIDFRGGPTGRFSNGRTVIDMIGKSNYLIID